MNGKKLESAYLTYIIWTLENLTFIFVKKLGKGKFSMLEITDLTDDRTKIGKRNWKQFLMK